MRRLITEKLLSWKSAKDRKPLILEGARQVGKTYVLKEFGKNSFKKVHYINFEDKEKFKSIFEEDLNPQRIISDLNLNFDLNIDVSKDLLILDEIQNCPRAITSMKYFCENMPELALVAAGSLLGVKLGSFSFPVGKVDMLNMYPMSFEEFLLALDKQALVDRALESTLAHKSLWELLKIYFIVGGLPQIVMKFLEYKDNHGKAFEAVREEQAILINAYHADIAKHSGKTNSMHIESLWSNAAFQLGADQDGAAPKFKFKNAVPGLMEYSRIQDALHWLLKTGLLLKCPILKTARLPLKAYTEENKFKLFIFDVGILGALADLKPSTILNYEYGTYKGFYAENFIAQELVALEARTDRLFSWRGKSSEIEFVLDINGQIVPVEVKSGSVTKSKSLTVFEEKYKPERSIIMSAKEFNNNSKRLKLPLYLAHKIKDFLT